MINIIFVCYSPKYSILPTGASIRCNRFADYLKEHGYNTSVLNFNKYEIRHNILGIICRLIIGYLKILSIDINTVIWVHNAWSVGFSVWLATLFKKYTLILDIDDYYISGCLGRFILSRLIYKSKIIICASDYLKDELQKLTNKPVYVINGGVETKEINHITRSNRVNVKLLWAGNINKESCRNIIKLLDLFKLVRSINSNVIFNIRGGGSHEYVIRNKITKENIEGAEILSAQNDYNKYLGTVDIAVSYLFDNIYDKSKNPGKLYYYLAAGLPIVGNSIGENRKVIINGETGILVDNDDKYIDGILQLANSFKLRQEYGKRCRELAEKLYDRKIIVDKLALILKKEIV